MSTVKFTKYKHYLYDVKIYVSDVPFTKDTLPTTVYQFQNINDTDVEVNIDYATVKYVMFRAEDGYGNVSFGDLLNINVLEDYVSPSNNGNIITINSLFMLSNEIIVDGNVFSVCRHRPTNSIISLVYHSDTATYDVISFNASTNSVQWIKQNVTQYSTNWITLQDNPSWYKYEMEIYNGYVYVCIGTHIFIVNVDGGDVLINDTSTIPVGYVNAKDFSSYFDPGDEIVITDFVINGNTNSLYMISNDRIISKVTVNADYSDTHFHQAMDANNYHFTVIDDHNYFYVYSAAPYKDKIIISTSRYDSVVDDHIRDVLLLVDVDSDMIIRVDQFINDSSFPSQYHKCFGYKNGKLFIPYSGLNTGYTNYLTSHVIVYDVNTETVVTNRQFEKIIDHNIFLAYDINVCDDEETLYISCESSVSVLLLYNIIKDELYSYEFPDKSAKLITLNYSGTSDLL